MYLDNWQNGNDWIAAEVANLIAEYSASYDKATLSLATCRNLMLDLSQQEVKGTITWYVPRLKMTNTETTMCIQGEIHLLNQPTEIESIVSLNQYTTIMDACKAVLHKLLYRALTMYALNENALRLTQDVMALLEASEVTGVSVEFAMGYTLFNLRDDHIGIGIKPDILWSLKELVGEDLLDPDTALARGVIDSFTALPCMIEALRRRTAFSKCLGFYTWKSAKTLLRSAYHTTVRVARNKIGYQADGDCYALIDVRICDERDIRKMQDEYGEENVRIMPNEHPRSTDYVLARGIKELEALKTRYDKHEGCTYRVEDMGDDVYHLVHKQFICHAYVFSPTNLKTYEKQGSVHSDVWAGELLGV